jgi:hypothetical protein
MFVYCCDLDEDQITFDDQFMQKSRSFQMVSIPLLATVALLLKYTLQGHVQQDATFWNVPDRSKLSRTNMPL